MKLRSRGRGGFAEKSLATFVRRTDAVLFAERTARLDGWLQGFDPRLKICGFLALIVDVTLARNIITIMLIFAFGVVLGVMSGVPVRSLATRTWLPALMFTGTIAVPALFITPGDILLQLPLLGWTVTQQGLASTMYLIARVETTATLAMLLVLCTPWTHILKALRVLRVPVVFVVILGMTHRYIFVMLETAENMFEARKSRMVGVLSGREKRRMAAASIGVLLTKSFYLNNEVFLAMQSRGFRGEVYVLDEFSINSRDLLGSVIFFLAAVAAFLFGRQDSLTAILNL